MLAAFPEFLNREKAGPTADFCAMQRIFLPTTELSLTIRSVIDLLKQLYVHVGKHTRLPEELFSVRGVGRDNEDDNTSCLGHVVLEHQVTLVHIDAQKRLCVYREVDIFWLVVVSQNPIYNVSLLRIVLSQKPLAILSGYFTDFLLRWSTKEKTPL